MSKQRTQQLGVQLKELRKDLADAREQEQIIAHEHSLAQQGVSIIIQHILELEKELGDLHV